MFAILWRLIALVLLMPFVMFPVLNFIAIPLALYLAASLVSRAWRRNAKPGLAD